MSHVSQAEDVQSEQQAEKDRSSELEARRLGWVDKEEFKGDPDKWRPADEFLDRGRRILPIVQANERRLHRRVDELENLLKETRESTKELLEFTNKTEERAYARARTEIMARVEQGAANADPNAVRTGMQELDALNKEHAPAKKTEAPRQQTTNIDPNIQDWIDKEKWFLRDNTLKAYATDVYAQLEKEKPGMEITDILAETKRRTMDKFPEKFGVNPARESAAAVGAPSGVEGRRKKGWTFADLPEEAKRACDKFVKSIPGYTREKYVADYPWES